jgi:hypothetical protein
MIRAHQPGSQPLDIPEAIPNPAVPKPTPAPSPAPSEPVKVPAPQVWSIAGKSCASTSMALCHWPCSCYPNDFLGQVHDWMRFIPCGWPQHQSRARRSRRAGGGEAARSPLAVYLHHPDERTTDGLKARANPEPDSKGGLSL